MDTAGAERHGTIAERPRQARMRLLITLSQWHGRNFAQKIGNSNLIRLFLLKNIVLMVCSLDDIALEKEYGERL